MVIESITKDEKAVICENTNLRRCVVLTWLKFGGRKNNETKFASLYTNLFN